MKRILTLLIVTALLGACNGHREEASTVYNKVSSCCKSLSGVKSMAGVCEQTENSFVTETANPASFIDNPTQILVW